MNKTSLKINRIQELNKEINEYNQFFKNKINYINNIIQSVLNKCYSNDIYRIENFYERFPVYKSYKLVSNKKMFIESFENFNTKVDLNTISPYNNFRAEHIVVDLSLFYKSDREIAKQIRISVKTLMEEEYEKERKQSSKKIKNNKKEIERLHQEIQKLEQIQQNILDYQNKKVKDTEEKLINRVKLRKENEK